MPSQPPVITDPKTKSAGNPCGRLFAGDAVSQNRAATLTDTPYTVTGESRYPVSICTKPKGVMNMSKTKALRETYAKKQ